MAKHRHLERVAKLQGELEGAIEREQYLDALRIAEEIENLVREDVGEDDPAYEICRENIAASLFHLGRYPEAADLFQQNVNSRAARLGPDHPDLENNLVYLTDCHYSTGNFRAAEPVLRQLLRIREKQGPAVSDMANIAVCLREQGKYGEAEEFYRRVLTAAETTSGKQSMTYARALNNYAYLLKSAGDYIGAVPPYRESLEILAEKDKGKEQYVLTMANLAILYDDLGNENGVAEMHDAIDAAFRESPDIAPDAKSIVLNNRALRHLYRGNYAAAKRSFEEALETVRSLHGESHPRYATALSNLGVFYIHINDYAKAEPLFQQSLTIRRASLGEDNPEVGQSLNNLAEVARARGRLALAAEYLELSIGVKRRAFKGQHPSLATSLSNLGYVRVLRREWGEAERLMEEALDCIQNTVGEQHPDYAQSLQNLGDLHKRQANYIKAEPYFERAISLLSERFGASGNMLIATANLAEVYAATGRHYRALTLLDQVISLDGQMTSQVFAVTSESQRMKLLETVQIRDWVYLSLVFGHRPASEEAVRAAFELVLRRKALGAEALAAQRDGILGGRHPHLQTRLQEIVALRRAVARVVLAGPGTEGKDAHADRIAKWTEDRERLEAALADSIPEIELSRRFEQVGTEGVARHLPKGASLVEFVKLPIRNFDAATSRGDRIWYPERYIAFTLLPGSPHVVRMVDLGEAEAIDRLVGAYRDGVTAAPERRPARWPEVGRGLRAAVFDKLVPLLGERRRLFIAPDGELNLLPFEALPLADGRHILEEYQITYLTCGRDALRFSLPPFKEPGPAVVVADPAFNLTASPTQTASPTDASRHSGELNRGLRFWRLPHTRKEGEQVAEFLGVKPWLDGEALEGRVKQAQSPRVLHLATHGFMLPDQPSRTTDDLPTGDLQQRLSGAGMENPLLRSGLALAGANIWLRGGALPGEAEDGLLTAEDVTGMDLLDTELVVLSACETGLGSVHVGEGVFGLRRAFVLAGARRLVMSLWKVPDAQTQELMGEFYQRVTAGQAVPEALRGAKRAMKAKYPDPYFWGAFVAQGDPAPFHHQGQAARPIAATAVD